MVEVSQKFKDLSRENGRHVYCRIEVGGEVFLDDRLLEFTFDDVTHPDWFTLGTTCANRFHFSARFSGELEVGAEVRPYISFDNEEWCPLGIFYISRRYVRGNTISITSYYKMYSLDIEYRYDGAKSGYVKVTTAFGFANYYDVNDLDCGRICMMLCAMMVNGRPKRLLTDKKPREKPRSCLQNKIGNAEGEQLTTKYKLNKESRFHKSTRKVTSNTFLCSPSVCIHKEKQQWITQ